jgi:hypothetical protein
MNRKRQSWRERESTRETQQAIWDAEKKAQADWNAKSRTEQIEDARFVLHWLPRTAQAVIDGYVWMSDALASAKAVEAKAIEAAAKMGFDGRGSLGSIAIAGGRESGSVRAKEALTLWVYFSDEIFLRTYSGLL